VDFRIRQVTTYSYASSVPIAVHALRLTPLSSGEQQLLKSEIDIDPQPDERIETTDFFGNRVVQVAILRAHSTLRLEARAEVRVGERPFPLLEAMPTCAEVRAEAARSQRLDARSPAHFLFPSRLVPLESSIRDYAAESSRDERPLLEGALELAKRINSEFAYDAAATDVTTPVDVAFAKRRGVCQDFAQVMISGLRGVGLPAAYVSGYLKTNPPPGSPRLEGVDATHAWVAVWCGGAIGWRGLDPTNGIPVGLDHIELAVGRDYADVAPVDGVIVASGGQSLAVAVDVVPME
jgi:transglutaminase-like putative cysteine protease